MLTARILNISSTYWKIISEMFLWSYHVDELRSLWYHDYMDLEYWFMQGYWHHFVILVCNKMEFGLFSSLSFGCYCMYSCGWVRCTWLGTVCMYGWKIQCLLGCKEQLLPYIIMIIYKAVLTNFTRQLYLLLYFWWLKRSICFVLNKCSIRYYVNLDDSFNNLYRLCKSWIRMITLIIWGSRIAIRLIIGLISFTRYFQFPVAINFFEILEDDQKNQLTVGF